MVSLWSSSITFSNVNLLANTYAICAKHLCYAYVYHSEVTTFIRCPKACTQENVYVRAQEEVQDENESDRSEIKEKLMFVQHKDTHTCTRAV